MIACICRSHGCDQNDLLRKNNKTQNKIASNQIFSGKSRPSHSSCGLGLTQLRRFFNLSSVLNQETMHSSESGTCKSALNPNAEKNTRAKIVFCGKEIEFGLDSEESERMAPEIVKQKWRREQIMAQKYLNEHTLIQKSSTLFPRKSKQDQIDDMPSNSNERSASPEMCLEEHFCSTPTISDCQQAPICSVWCGWLHVRFSDMEGFFKPSKRWWTALNVDREQLELECYLEDAETCAMTLARSLALDPARPARRKSAMLACGGRARVSIAERGSALICWQRRSCLIGWRVLL